ncbi:5-deoxy-glucuronate isomerase, partial [Streptomyces pyxinae]|uniref:5-deoxy-glucuronate isomerase n=1 Tax=Streptomyces pyxinae TaxID=2970734 RepID=UPI003D1676BF
TPGGNWSSYPPHKHDAPGSRCPQSRRRAPGPPCPGPAGRSSPECRARSAGRRATRSPAPRSPSRPRWATPMSGP